MNAKAYTAGYLSKQAGELSPALYNWLSKVEGFLPKAKRITNARGKQEKHPTVGTGHYLSDTNKVKLQKLWGADRYKEIAGGAAIKPGEDRKASKQHLNEVVSKQLDSWNPNWRKLNPMLQSWLQLHGYSLGNNLKQFRQGHNAVNAVTVNPTETNLEKLRSAFRDSLYAKQTGDRLDKMKPLFEAGKRRALVRGRK